MATRVPAAHKRDLSALDLNDRAVLHYALMKRTKDGLFGEKPVEIAIELNSSEGTIIRTFHSLVRKHFCDIIETNRKTAKGYPLPTIYRPIAPVEWACYFEPTSPVESAGDFGPTSPVESAPKSNESSPVPPVKWANPTPNGALEALQSSLSPKDCIQEQQSPCAPELAGENFQPEQSLDPFEARAARIRAKFAKGVRR